jgi:hypothetical protein
MHSLTKISLHTYTYQTCIIGTVDPKICQYAFIDKDKFAHLYIPDLQYIIGTVDLKICQYAFNRKDQKWAKFRASGTDTNLLIVMAIFLMDFNT